MTVTELIDNLTGFQGSLTVIIPDYWGENATPGSILVVDGKLFLQPNGILVKGGVDHGV